MPAVLDLVGRRFGKLVVVGRAANVKYGLVQSAWTCACDCGTTITLPRSRLPYKPGMSASQIVEACDACRLARHCVICGDTFIPASSRAITCSETCSRQNRAQKQIKAAKVRNAANPENLQKAQAAYRERVKTDATRAANQKAYKRDWYERNFKRISEQRRADRLHMTAEERRKAREYMRAWHEELRADPERHAAHLSSQLEIRRKTRLAALVRLGAAMKDQL